MRAVVVGVGHHDDFLVAQPLVVVLVASAAAQRLHQVQKLLVALELVRRGAGDVEDLAAQGKHRLGRAVARLLGRAAGGIALHQEQLRSEEHTSELQSLMRISYAVFCLKKKKKK